MEMPEIIRFKIRFSRWGYLIFVPNDKILGRTKLKAYADDKIILAEMIVSFFDGIENIVWKKEKMLVTSIFSFFYRNVFKNFLFLGLENSVLCGKGLLYNLNMHSNTFSKRIAHKLNMQILQDATLQRRYFLTGSCCAEI